MQAIGRQPQRAPAGAPGPLRASPPRADHAVPPGSQQHAATFFAQAEDAAGAELPQFFKDEFDAILECGILANGLPRTTEVGISGRLRGSGSP